MSSFTNKINYSLNITGGNLNVSGSSTLGSLYTATGTIGQLVSTNVSADSFIGSSGTLSGTLSAGNLNVNGVSNTLGSIFTNNGPLITSNTLSLSDEGVSIRGISTTEYVCFSTYDLEQINDPLFILSDQRQPPENSYYFYNEPYVRYFDSLEYIGLDSTNIQLTLQGSNESEVQFDLIIKRNSSQDTLYTFTIFENNFTSDNIEIFPGDKIQLINTTNEVFNFFQFFLNTFNYNYTYTEVSVGIGTSNPNARLQIAGNSGAIGLDLATADQYAEMRVIRNSSSNIDKNMYIQLGAGNNSKLKLYSNNNETITLDDGAVGIGMSELYGITNPRQGAYGVIGSAKLTILGNPDQDQQGIATILIGAHSAQYSSITAEHTGLGNTYLSFGTSSGNEFGGSGPNEKMRITSNGNVGIGRSSPVSKLDVDGVITSGGITTGTVLITNGTVSNLYSANSVVNNATVTNLNAINVTAGTFVGSTATLSGNLTVGGDFIVSGTTTTINTEITTIEDNLLVLNSGPLPSVDAGILMKRFSTGTTGTANYAGMFYKETTDEMTFALTNSDPGSSPVTVSSYLPIRAQSLNLESSGTIPQLLTTNVSSGTLISTTKLLAIGNSNTIGNLFTTGGNVGIGTSSPSEKLHVNTIGDSYIRISSSAAAKSGIKMIGGTLGIASIYHDDNSQDIKIDWDSSNLMTIKTNGNVGIGISSPESKLDVNGTLKAANTNGSLIFASSGNVGVGTTTPGYKLVVSGDIYATGDIIAYSDERLKSNVSTLSNALDKVNQMRGVSYTLTKTGQKSIGLIAQEVQKILPEIVAEKEEYLGVAYGNIVGLLVEAIKELNEKVRSLENKLNE